MKSSSKGVAVVALIMGSLITLYELTWLGRSRVAMVLVGLGVCVVLLAVSALLGQKERNNG